MKTDEVYTHEQLKAMVEMENNLDQILLEIHLLYATTASAEHEIGDDDPEMRDALRKLARHMDELDTYADLVQFELRRVLDLIKTYPRAELKRDGII